MIRPILTVLVLAAVIAAPAAAQDPQARHAPRNYEIGQDGSVTVRGKVLYSDQKQEQHEKVQGHASAVLWFPGVRDGSQFGINADLEIDDGAWRVTFANTLRQGNARPTHISLASCRIDDAAVVVETDKLALTDDAEFLFRLRVIPQLRLRVVDAATKKELDGVEVFRSVDWHDLGALHPGSAAGLQRLVENGRSPLVISPPDGVAPGRSERLWLRAPDHAWQSVEVLIADGGTRDVPLPRAGAVTVVLGGNLPAGADKLALRFYKGRQSGPPLAEFAVADGKVDDIEGLTAGSYEARLELGEWFRNPRVLARVSVIVEAGGTAAVRLDVKAEVTAPAKVTLRGIVAIPAGWHVERGDIGIELKPLLGTQQWAETRWLHGSELKRGDKDGEYRFAFADVVAGRYAIVVSPSFCQQAVKVAEGSNGDLRIEVPEPVEVVVHVVDSDTRKPHNGVSLDWHPRLAPGVTSWSPGTAQAAADSNEIRFVAPAGRIQVSAFGDDYELRERTLEVAPDDHEFELTTHAVYGVKVVLYEGDTKIPTGFRSGWQLDLHQLNGKARLSGTRGDGTLIVREPGTYILSVEAPDGYRPVPDRQVKLSSGPFPTIDIKVARK
ncbi:MAG TPA: hypothetical protein VK348_15865 [Planctomycetota bacterium]|nr:hypothetical protein [Planctomycetota bacterium]